MAHIFIVNKITFKKHLEYKFAGTGAGNVSTDFIFDSSIKLNSQDEKRSIGMITDVSRIRKGDKIIFFVTGISMFYGIFEAKSEFFLDPNDENNYLKDDLKKVLTYRILLSPYKVYKNGISEYDCLDSLKGVTHPDEICWSLIYRKLGGNRGCTMITNQEYEILEKKITQNNTLLNGTNFSFNDANNEIVLTDIDYRYQGRQIDIFDKLKANFNERYSKRKAFEHYIQYFTVIALKKNNKLLTSNSPITWIGNEVMCSFGEHRIDVMAIQENDEIVDISLIELKDEKISSWIIYQIDGYLKWLLDYITPYYERNNKKIIVHPIIISDGIPNSRKSTKEKLNLTETDVINHAWSNYEKNEIKVSKTKIIHFNNNSDIVPE